MSSTNLNEISPAFISFLEGQFVLKDSNGNVISLEEALQTMSPVNYLYLKKYFCSPKIERAIQVRIDDGCIMFLNKRAELREEVTLLEDGTYIVPLNFSSAMEKEINGIDWVSSDIEVIACLIFTAALNYESQQKWTEKFPLLVEWSEAVEKSDIMVFRAFCSHLMWALTNSYFLRDDNVAENVCLCDWSMYDTCFDDEDVRMGMFQNYKKVYESGDYADNIKQDKAQFEHYFGVFGH